jgi:hypothetical protein
MSARYRPGEFVESGWATGTPAKKARFVNALVRFIDSGYPEAQFTKALYDGLYNHGYFGFIAHCDRYGFYDAQFSTLARQRQFFADLIRDCERDYLSTRFGLWADVKTVLADHYQQQPEPLFTVITATGKEHPS